ncbi:LacI family DNA-binding transcriptional regulator [Corynebacterium pacaense]|uniref:LacI family DNA-binding transcriptional regulator n=1 Tax=Corynebacterium pacaense TaxID=1816684 RepID=UPI0009B955FF|nr:LacI family DNA-binding transcriptional regulator [Corynebacterium pacaense]
MSPHRRGSRGATIADVAKLAGVSTATVSRALHGSANVGPGTLEKVARAAEELNFSVTRSASALASGRTNRIALLNGGQLAHWFVSEILQGSYTHLNQSNMDLLIYRAGSRTEREQFFTALPARRNADAMLVTSFALEAEEVTALESLGMPVVYLNMPYDDRPNVSIDDVAAGSGVARHLIGLGHRRLAFVGTGLTHLGFDWSSDDRSRGFAEQINASEHAISFESITVANTPRAASEAVTQILNLSPIPTGIFVLHDELALAITHILRQRGLRVPEDISVIGFDDHPLAEPFGLTTVRQPVEEIGRRGAELAVKLARGEDPGNTNISIPTSLIMRTTSSTPQASVLLS